MRGSSMTDIGDYNEKLVLHTIRSASEEIGQSEVGRRSNLSRQAVSLITRRLVADGLIETAGRRISGPGKPHTLLRVVSDARLAVGVHLDPAHITVVICDLAATPLAKSTLDAPTADPTHDIARVAAEIDVLRRSIGAVAPHELNESEHATGGTALPRRVLLGIGIAAPGGLDSAAGVVRNPPWVPWRDVPVVAAMEEATGLPALLDKDTNAALTGEIWSRYLSGHETVLYVYASHGVGSAVSANGQVHRGASTQAGEIGHLPTGRTDQLCGCGNHGCLSLYTDAHLLVDRARESGTAVPAGVGVKKAVRTVSGAADDGDEGAREAIHRYGAALGHALRTLAGIHDPQRIIIGGPAWPALCPHAMPAIRDVLGEWQADQGMELESSHLGDDVGALGAASLFLEQELSPGNGLTVKRVPARPAPSVGGAG